MNNYNSEVVNKWGHTNIYKEYSNKTKNYSSSKWDEVNNGLNHIFIEFALILYFFFTFFIFTEIL